MFYNPYMFLLFLLLPFLVLMFFIEMKSHLKIIEKVSGKNSKIVFPNFSYTQKWVRNILFIMGFIFLVLGLARPKWGYEEVKDTFYGKEIIFLLDTSFSMQTKDIYPDRLNVAKVYINKVLESGGENRIGLVVFDDRAELIVPPTTDYSAISYFLESVVCGMVNNGGTDIGYGLKVALESFDDGEFKNRIVVLITDGEDLENNYDSIRNQLKDKNLKVITVGVGTPNGEPVPIIGAGGQIEGYVKDRNGNPVVSKLDEKLLTQIANDTAGVYLKATGKPAEIVELIKNVKGVKNSKTEEEIERVKKDQYVIFFLVSLILFSIGLILDFGKINFRSLNGFGNFVKLFIFVIVFVFIDINTYTQNQKNDSTNDLTTNNLSNRNGKNDIDNKNGNIIRKYTKNGPFFGNMDYRKGKYNEALSNYSKSLFSFSGNDLAKLYYNMGNAFLKLNDIKNSVTYFDKANGLVTDKKLKTKILYNSGIVNFKNKEYKKATEAFKQALMLEPSDNDIRYNYEVAKLFSEKKDKNQEEKKEQNNQQNVQNQKNDILKALEEKEKEKLKEQNRNKINRGGYW